MFKKSVQQQLLSHHYPRKPIKSNKLSLFGKAIAVIDTVKIDQQLLNSVLELDLSHNGIFEIEDIQQFSNVEFLNLSHNKLNEEQVIKLKSLGKMHTLYMKGNPFLKSKLSVPTLRFLLSLNTDIDLVSSDTARLIQSYTAKTIQNQCFNHYLHKIQVHIQLINNYQADDSFVDTSYAMFPKIKKIFQKIGKERCVRRQLVERIEEKWFEDEAGLGKYLAGRVEVAEEQRSVLIKKIYEREELLRNVRSTYNVRNAPRRTVPRQINIVTGQSPLKESKKQEKTKSLLRFHHRNEHRENSPPKLSSIISQSDLVPQSQQSFINTLTKINSLYHLLHSPLTSLKSHEKDLLIQNLCLHLKQRMKEIAKFQRREQEYQRIKEENSELQEHLRDMSAQVKGQQEKNSEKLKRMSSIFREESERVENLCEELGKCKEELSLLKQENEELKVMNSRIRQDIQRLQRSQNNEQILRERYELSLKSKYLNQLSHKAYHLNQLAMLQQINRKTDEKWLKEQSFLALRRNIEQLKNSKSITNFILKKHMSYILNKGRHCIALSSKRKQLYTHLRTHRIQQFYTTLKNFTFRSKQINAILQRVTKARANKIKRTIFAGMKRLLEQKEQDRQLQSTKGLQRTIIMRKCLLGWKRVIVETQDKQIQGISKIISVIKASHLKQFTQRCTSDLTYKSAKLATEDFLIKIRKIKCYLRFSRTVSTTLFNRGLKVQRVEVTRKHRYLSWFISTIRDCQIRKRIVIEREIQLKKREEESAKRLVKTSRKKKIGMFQNLLYRVYGEVKHKIINREKAWIALSKQKQTNSLRAFMESLRSNWIQNYKIASKTLTLSKSPIITNKIKDFYKKFAQNVHNCIAKSKQASKGKLMRCFYRWKFFLLWQKAEDYKARLRCLQPQIAEVSMLQRQIQKEKQLLLLEIQQKEMLVRDFQKKCQEYEYVLHSKDLKYQKLKDIYADSMRQNQMNTTVKLNTRQQTQEDIYKKYLPLQLKNKYSCKLKTTEDDRPDKYSNPQKYQLPNPTQTPARGSFISSFKRF